MGGEGVRGFVFLSALGRVERALGLEGEAAKLLGHLPEVRLFAVLPGLSERRDETGPWRRLRVRGLHHQESATHNCCNADQAEESAVSRRDRRLASAIHGIRPSQKLLQASLPGFASRCARESGGRSDFTGQIRSGQTGSGQIESDIQVRGGLRYQGGKRGSQVLGLSTEKVGLFGAELRAFLFLSKEIVNV